MISDPVFFVSRQCRWGNAAAIDGLDGPDRRDGQNAEEMALRKKHDTPYFHRLGSLVSRTVMLGFAPSSVRSVQSVGSVNREKSCIVLPSWFSIRLTPY